MRNSYIFCPINVTPSDNTVCQMSDGDGATRDVNYPTRNYTYVYFNCASTNTSVYTIDYSWDPNVLYNRYTVISYITFLPWIARHPYSVTFDNGVGSGTEFCGPESAPITDPRF